MKKYIALFMIVIFSFGAKATHISGSEITWTCDGNGKYILVLGIYHDCPFGTSQMTVGTDAPMGSITLNKDTTYRPFRSCGMLDTSACGGGSFGIGKSIYTSAPQSLGTIPAAGYHFSWDGHGFVSSQNVSSTSKMYVETTIYPPAVPSCGTAPIFTPYLDNTLGPNRTISTAVAYFHPGDSLHYALQAPRTSSTVNASFKPNFSGTQPFSNPQTDVSNDSVLIDSKTGLISMNVQSGVSGHYYYGVKIEAWRNGALASEVERILLAFLPQNPTVNNDPNANIDTAIFTEISQVHPGYYRAFVKPGDTLDFNISASDFDFNSNGSPQQIIFEARGQALDSAWNPVGSPFLKNAQLSPVAPQSGFIQSLNNNIRFYWETDSQHLVGPGPTSHFFLLAFYDNVCNQPGEAINLLEVIVQPGSGGGVDLTESEEAAFKVFPNPAREMVMVKDLQPGGKLLLLDLHGKVLQSFQVSESQISIQRNGLPSSLYLIKHIVDGYESTRPLMFE